MDRLDELVRLIAAMNAEGVAYVLVGGAALNVHGIVRATEDVDIFIAPNAPNVEALKRALRRVWDDSEIDGITASDLLGDYPAIQYGPPGDTLSLDILTRLGELAYDDLEAQTVTIAGVAARVAPTSASLEERIAAAWEGAHPFGKMPLYRGVRKFSTLADARAFRASVTAERIRRIQEIQAAGPRGSSRGFVVRTLRNGEADDGLFDMKFWRDQGAPNILSAAWDMVNEARRMRGESGDEPRLQRSLLRVIQRGR